MPAQAPVSYFPASDILWDIATDASLAGVNPAGTLVCSTAVGQLRRGLWRVQMTASSNFSAVLGAGSPTVRAAVIGGVAVRTFGRQLINDVSPFKVDGLVEIFDPAVERLALSLDPLSTAMIVGDYLHGILCATFVGNR